MTNELRYHDIMLSNGIAVKYLIYPFMNYLHVSFKRASAGIKYYYTRPEQNLASQGSVCVNETGFLHQLPTGIPYAGC